MNQIPLINYNIIAEAVRFYQSHGFKYIDVPWAVDEDAIKATLPPNCDLFPTPDGCLVGSGEQSFIHMDMHKELPPGRYICVTPCFRDESVIDDLHFRRFFKAELINCTKPLQDNPSMLCLAKEFYSSYLPVKIKDTDIGFDIVTDDEREIELGSYGTRKHNGFEWIYGTAVAEPRLSQTIKTLGYHSSIIRRAKPGTIDKVLEEAYEYIDSDNQNNKIMGILELSDLIGAVECLLESNHPDYTLNDLITMSNATRKAFREGRR